MLKFFGIVGLAGYVVTAYLVTFGVGPERQLPPSVSLLEGFREEGFVPKNRNLAFDETAEEMQVFVVPEQDGVILAAARASDPMAGMDMSGSTEGMDMSGGDTSTTTMEGMDMTGSGAAPVLDMDMNGDGIMDTSSASLGSMTGSSDGSMAGMDMGTMDMEGMQMTEGGLGFAAEAKFDREIKLSMEEWTFSDLQIDVKMGERIKFTVKNDGQIPHEFMFMSAPLMAAASYRGKRADWNLFEHEALFEQSLVLPGGEFTFVLQVQEAGSWMFMCMLPYHMQMGMMGQMATKGMAMNMDM